MANRPPMNLSLKKGALRRRLKTKTGHKIPLAVLQRAARSRNKLTKKRAVLALSMRKWKH